MHLRTVSRSGHSHAVSMCAWPTATVVCALARAGSGERRGEHLPRLRRGAADVVEVEHVEGPLQRPQQAGPARVVQREGAHGPVQDLDVEDEVVDRAVEDGQVGLAEAVERCGRRGVERAHR